MNDTVTLPNVVDNAAKHERGLTPQVEEVWKLSGNPPLDIVLL
jgi:hypothetical protein